MSRVHDALKKAEQAGYTPTPQPPNTDLTVGATESGGVSASLEGIGAEAAVLSALPVSMVDILDQVEEIPFNPRAGACLINKSQPTLPPGEEFRTLRTRLNHIQA